MTIELAFQNLPDYFTIELTLENIYLDGSAATHSNTLLHTAILITIELTFENIYPDGSAATHCNTLQHTSL